MTDELFRRRMHFRGPQGFEPCTRPWPHDGPCAHPPSEATGAALFMVDYCDWLFGREKVAQEYAEALPCQCTPDGFDCRNCRLAKQAIEAICGPPPHRGDYR